MAKVNNLHIVTSSTESPKKTFFTTDRKNLRMSTIKKIYFNDVLIWQNSNPFLFVTDMSQIDTKQLESDTLIFVGFNKDRFEGTYDIMENEQDIPKEKGQMVVENTTEGDD